MRLKSLNQKKTRISAILVGNNSLDANIGHLCAMTGGQVFYAPGNDVASAINSSLTSLRSAKSILSGEIAAQSPLQLAVQRAGVEVAVSWNATQTDANCDALGRYAAALALPLLDTDAAQTLAEAHCLCSHMTSLVLVDEVGVMTNMLPEMRKIPLMAPKRSQMMHPCCSERSADYRMGGAKSPLGWLLMLLLIPALILALPFIILWKIPSLLRQIWHMAQTGFQRIWFALSETTHRNR